MCKLFRKEALVLDEAIEAYKVVRSYGAAYYSQFDPNGRDAVEEEGVNDAYIRLYDHLGTDMQYYPGQSAIAREEPGMMVYLVREHAMSIVRRDVGYAMLIVTAPAGGQIRMGWHRGRPVMCCMTLNIHKEVTRV